MNVGVGVIGAGLMGSTHVRTLATMVPLSEVRAISDALPEAAQRIAAEVSVETVYPEASELIGDPEVEAVVIASPADTHEELVLACLQHGKPVLCEKPLAPSAQAARGVFEAEATLGHRLVQVGFMRRFDPGYLDLRSRLQDGAIGTPLLAYSTHRNPSVPPAFGSEMIIKDTVVHDVDTMRWLLGHEIVRATVFTPRPSSNAPHGVSDPQMVVFETDMGALVQVEAFVNAQYGYDIRCEIVGESGTLTLTPPATAQLRQDGRHGIEVPMRFQDRFATAYVRELQGWVASIADGAPAGANAWDGYAASAVCEAAWAAMTTRRPTEVRLGPKPALYAGADDLIAAQPSNNKDGLT